MLRLEPIELFLRAIPESFLAILAVYIFSNTPINKKKYIITSLIGSCVFFGVRMLPIDYGVHTILAIGIIIIISVLINKIDIIKAIKAEFIYSIFQFIAEGLNIFIIQNILKADMNKVFSNAVLKTVYGLPSLAILGFIIFLYYIITLKKDELINV
ncbi:hypothetical protein [Clostridium gasigenes]|uniref:Uncharacterized protein n=1 Tax=Clostridium gasigenes TaxID=94869 RepID=A0A1H0M1A4_9CLOT|nr:hypothetical protein [Clostridium gasigenes]MBB6713811.1 hypothetical protein [Clostridium gasigenes]MBU3105916.1 hypothetical protein [Clostridium gasigenes]SDO74197.1 hypothetical protein SAMN04488529_101284 [Clostridium gasigenes]